MSDISFKKAKIGENETKIEYLEEKLEYYLDITIDNIGIWYESLCVVSDINTKNEADAINSIKCCDHLKSEIALTQEACELAKTDLADYFVKTIGIPGFYVYGKSFIFKENIVIFQFLGTNGIYGDAVFQITTDKLLSISNPYEIGKTLEEFLL